MSDLAPDEVFDYYGEPCGIWGQSVVPAGEEIDPVPAVYATGSEVSVGDYRLSINVAEAYAERILTAVRYQRALDSAKETPADV
jgi:hypothetical protein